VSIAIKAMTGYNTNIGNEIVNSVSTYINQVSIGGTNNGGIVEWDECVIQAKLPGNVTNDGGTFRIQSVQLSSYGGTLASSDLTLTAGYTANSATSDITLTVS
jgi:hypothetical protein